MKTIVAHKNPNDPLDKVLEGFLSDQRDLGLIPYPTGSIALMEGEKNEQP